MPKPSDQKPPTPPDAQTSPGARTPPVKWDTTNLKSSYANFCNANSTREEMVLNFGINKAWERGPAESLDIELNHRIVLSPFAVRCLSELMQ